MDHNSKSVAPRQTKVDVLCSLFVESNMSAECLDAKLNFDTRDETTHYHIIGPKSEETWSGGYVSPYCYEEWYRMISIFSTYVLQMSVHEDITTGSTILSPAGSPFNYCLVECVSDDCRRPMMRYALCSLTGYSYVTVPQRDCVTNFSNIKRSQKSLCGINVHLVDLDTMEEDTISVVVQRLRDSEQ